MKSWTFTVEGQGNFPLDMLRYDACYPRDNDSVANTDMKMQETRDARNVRRVTLRSYISAPTNDRWASFGWYVDKDSLRAER